MAIEATVTDAFESTTTGAMVTASFETTIAETFDAMATEAFEAVVTEASVAVGGERRMKMEKRCRDDRMSSSTYRSRSHRNRRHIPGWNHNR